MPHVIPGDGQIYCRAKFASISGDGLVISLEKNWTRVTDGVNLTNVSIMKVADGLLITGIAYAVLYEPWKEYIEITDELDSEWVYPSEKIQYRKAGLFSRLVGRKVIKIVPSDIVLVSKKFVDFSRVYSRLRIKNPQNAIVDVLPHYQNISYNENLLWATHQ